MLKDKAGNLLTRNESESIMKRRSSFVVSTFAALLAISAVLSNSTSSRILNDTLSVNDTWAFYQAKSIKQNLTELNISQLEQRLETTNDPEKKHMIENLIANKQAEFQHYENDTVSNEGKVQLLAKAKDYQNDRKIAKQKSIWFGLGSALLQIGIVLASSSILAISMPILTAGIIFGSAGALLIANGLFLFIQLPF